MTQLEMPELPPAPADEFTPSAEHIIALLAHEYGVSNDQAARWLSARFYARELPF